MKDAKREECDKHHDFPNTLHEDKLGISFASDKREDWKAESSCSGLVHAKADGCLKVGKPLLIS